MADAPQSTGFSLRRWSQRKLAATRGEPETLPRDGDAVNPAGKPGAAEPAATAAPAPAASTPAAAKSAADSAAAANATATPLPSLESLTADSDFSPFMQAGVDEDVKRMALRKLLRDPRFNVMDGLDVYIDDYSKPSPIEPGLVRTLAQARYIFDPPKTRVTAEGVVEDVPEAEVDVPREETPADPRTGSPMLADPHATIGTAQPPAEPAEREPASALHPPIAGKADPE